MSGLAIWALRRGMAGISLFAGELGKLDGYREGFDAGYENGIETGVDKPLGSDEAEARDIHDRSIEMEMDEMPIKGFDKLEIGLRWWIPGMLLAGVYHYFVYRHFAGKVKPEEEGY